jgi:hypothetical protein
MVLVEREVKTNPKTRQATLEMSPFLNEVFASS